MACGIDNTSDFIDYKIKTDDEELVTYIKLKMSNNVANTIGNI